MIRANCGHRNFKSLMVTQFLGALNDNIFKTAIYLLIGSTLIGKPEDQSLFLSLASAAYVVPFIIFSAHAGFLADRYSKVTVIRFAKAVEIVIALLAAYLLHAQQIIPLLIVLFFMGLHSTIFSPCKYGILPEILMPRELSRGNGYLELWTLVAILIGQALAAPIKIASDSFWGNPGTLPGAVIILVACAGYATSRRIDFPPPANPNAVLQINPFRETVRTVREISADTPLFLTLLAISYFSFAGHLVNLSAVILAAEMMPGSSDMAMGALLTALTLGIGFGSIFAGMVSAGKVELGLVPIGVIGIAIASFVLPLVSDSLWATLGVIIVLGFSGGMYIVPLNAFFQHRSPADRLGRFLAANNVLSFAGMLLASGMFWLLSSELRLPSRLIFPLIGASALVVGWKVVRTLPEVLVRCVNWLLAHAWYRLRVVGFENLPTKGGALLVCNHVSYVDPALLLAAAERPIRFMIAREIYEKPWVKPFASTMRAIPVSPTDPPRKLLAALREAREAIENGEIVGIFAEGAITRIGQLLPFSKGYERIIGGLDVPIIPMYLDQLWGSIFSFRGGKFFWKWPREFPYPATLVIGEPMPSSTPSYILRQQIQDLGAAATRYRRRRHQLLHRSLVRAARRHPFRTAVVDSSGASESFATLLGKALPLARLLRRSHAHGEYVGIYLPPSVPAAISNAAVLLAGLVPVNLNYTASSEGIRSSIEQCRIRTVLTARAFLEKVEFRELPEPLYLEDIRENLPFRERLACLLAAALLPERLLQRFTGSERVQASDVATVIFSSGSTGLPKGVMLSHENICSNIEGLCDLFQLDRDDCVMGILPFFHSFGFTATLWLPILGGVKALYHPNPLDAGVVGDLIRKHRATIFLSTPTFLLSYLRRCPPETFRSLKHLVVGAEKLKPSLAEAFAEKFGVHPREGYGCTELSPVALLNVPDYESDRFRQTGAKPGSVGHPIPGVTVRIVDPNTYEPLPPGREGLLLVKGPNVMLGYLANPGLTAEVIRDGWYVTGDIAKADEDGFVTITDRLARFSKIAGEMVPHVVIEDKIHEALKKIERVAVVTAVPDEKKGERLAVLHSEDLDAGDLVKQLVELGLPNLWVPKPDGFYRVSALPLLGSGKIDLKGVKEMARALSAEQPRRGAPKAEGSDKAGESSNSALAKNETGESGEASSPKRPARKRKPTKSE